MEASGCIEWRGRFFLETQRDTKGGVGKNEAVLERADLGGGGYGFREGVFPGRIRVVVRLGRVELLGSSLFCLES
jgi:hypothetical protein